MGDWPAVARPNMPTITPFSFNSLGMQTVGLSPGGAVASATAGTNIAMYFPWLVETPCTVTKGFVMNGASVNGNIDVGVYDHEFTLIVSKGATLQAGTNAIQELDITDTTIMPGRYWIGFVNTGTGTVFALTGVDESMANRAALLIQTGQTSLPSSATPIKNNQSSPVVPMFGFSIPSTI